MKFLQEFKQFALKGNVMNLAVGVIIGAAFQNVVTSLTNNILSPFIGLFTGQNFDTLSVSILGVPILYGAFITSMLNFIIMAFVVFLLVKAMNGILLPQKEVPAEQLMQARKCPYCMSEIHEQATRCPACTSALDS